MTKRRNFLDQFKAAVELEALRGDKTVLEIAAKRQLHPTQVSISAEEARNHAPQSSLVQRHHLHPGQAWL
jgi:transposase-like protein